MENVYCGRRSIRRYDDTTMSTYVETLLPTVPFNGGWPFTIPDLKKYDYLVGFKLGRYSIPKNIENVVISVSFNRVSDKDKEGDILFLQEIVLRRKEIDMLETHDLRVSLPEPIRCVTEWSKREYRTSFLERDRKYEPREKPQELINKYPLFFSFNEYISPHHPRDLKEHPPPIEAIVNQHIPPPIVSIIEPADLIEL